MFSSGIVLSWATARQFQLAGCHPVVPLASLQVSLLRVFPKTGRKHQIRVHLAHLNHPIVGDWAYGAREASALLCPRLFLHCRSITLRTIKNAQFTAEADLPPELAQVVEGLTLQEKLAQSAAFGGYGAGSSWVGQRCCFEGRHSDANCCAAKLCNPMRSRGNSIIAISQPTGNMHTLSVVNYLPLALEVALSAHTFCSSLG